MVEVRVEIFSLTKPGPSRSGVSSDVMSWVILEFSTIPLGTSCLNYTSLTQLEASFMLLWLVLKQVSPNRPRYAG